MSKRKAPEAGGTAAGKRKLDEPTSDFDEDDEYDETGIIFRCGESKFGGLSPPQTLRQRVPFPRTFREAS